MPPRLHYCVRCLRASQPTVNLTSVASRGARNAHAQAITPAPSPNSLTESYRPISRHPTSQPPSHKRPEERRSQLHRQYASLLRSTPMMLIYQHNNLKANEWMSLRRELTLALAKVDAKRAAEGHDTAPLAEGVKFQVIRGGVFGAALRVVEYYNPEAPTHIDPTDPSVDSSTSVLDAGPSAADPQYTHGLSRAAWEATVDKKLEHELAPLLSGPLAIVTFPAVSTEHLKAAFQIISPKAPAFPAPTRRLNPGYWEPGVQGAVQKLLLLGARVEGRVFDTDGARWVGAIEGGLEGLRGQLVAMLQSVGGGVTSTLEAAGKSLYLTVEGRRGMLEEETGEKKEADKAE